MSVVSSNQPTVPILNKDGTMSFAWVKWFQNIANTVNAGFDNQGNYQGPIGANATIVGRKYLATIVANLTDAGLLSSDFVIDGTGNPIAGGKAAYLALVLSAPTSGSTIRYNGTSWTAVAIAQTHAATASKWLASYDATTGLFTDTQPSFSDLTGVAVAGQLPPLSSLSGQITTSQLPAGLFSGTITTAKLTGGGSNGSMTFLNGSLVSQVPAT